jgi:hypothetical protein
VVRKGKEYGVMTTVGYYRGFATRDEAVAFFQGERGRGGLRTLDYPVLNLVDDVDVKDESLASHNYAYVVYGVIKDRSGACKDW